MIATLSPATAGGGLSLPDQVALCARHGFAGLEIGIGAVREMGIDQARALFQNSGVEPVVFGLPVEWRKDEETFRQGLAQLPELARIAADLGVSRCTTYVHPATDAPLEEYIETSTRRFAEIAKILDEQGISFGLEFLGPQQFRPDPDKFWFYDIAGALKAADEINRRAGTGNVGLLVDCWHWYASGGTLMDLASIPLEQIVHVHINDAPAGVAVSDLVDNVRELPGATGEIDIRGFLSTLKALGYEGPVAVETFSEKLKAMSPDDAATAGARATLGVMGKADKNS